MLPVWVEHNDSLEAVGNLSVSLQFRVTDNHDVRAAE